MKVAFFIFIFSVSTPCFAKYIYKCQNLQGTVEIDSDSGEIDIFNESHGWADIFKPLADPSAYRFLPTGTGGDLYSSDFADGAAVLRIPESALAGVNSFTLYGAGSSLRGGPYHFAKICHLFPTRSAP